MEHFDVVVLGGGLAGLTLASQLLIRDPSCSVLVLEKAAEPPPRTTHTVGESSVEIGSHYFRKVLGLTEILDEELPKYGLRFFFPKGDNQDITTRFELGPGAPPPTPAYHIDRGHFEAALAERIVRQGATLLRGCRVTGVTLGDPHEVQAQTPGGDRTFRARWVVDASGRRGLLKRQLGLAKDNGHVAHSAWFRIDRPIEPDDWGDADFAARMQVPRRLTTNHLMGPGYWAWLIPLAGDRTSVGIVVDDAHHPFSELRSLEGARAWLGKHEPQLLREVSRGSDAVMDFRALKDFSYGCKRVFSSQRWALTGEAGAFADPFYSPGSDLIGISNGFVVDLILRERAGEDIKRLAREYDLTYLQLYAGFMHTWRGQGALYGAARPMTLKIIWDFALYWATIAYMFAHDRMHHPSYPMGGARRLAPITKLNQELQQRFRRFHEVGDRDAPAGQVDYAALPFMRRLNASLVAPRSPAQADAELEDHAELLHELAAELRHAMGRSLGEAADPPSTTHLDATLSALRMG